MKTATELRTELDQAEQALQLLAPVTSGDPALARLGGTALRQHHRRTDAQLAAYSRQLARVEQLRGQLALALAREAEAARPRLTAADLHDAALVRTRHGWHKVIRVNTTTVTVETGYSWTDRISIDKILEVREVVA